MSRIFKSVGHNDVNQVKTINHAYTIPYQSTNNEKQKSVENSAHIETANQLIQDAEETAKKILEKAKQQAEQVRLETEKEIQVWWDQQKNELSIYKETVANEAYQEGVTNGYQDGFEKGLTDQENVVRQAKQILEESYLLKEQIIQEAEPTIIDLSLEIAKKIVIKEVEIDPTIVKSIAQETLRNVKETESIVINVGPNYFAYLQSAKEDLLMELNGQVKLFIYPDASIGDAGVLIKTENGTIDARIDTQLEELKQILLEVVNRRVS